MNLAHHLARNARARPDDPALARGTTVVATWAQMQARVSRLAGALRGTFRLAPGARVALVMKNCPVYAELLYACWHAGLAALPINAKLHPREIAYILDHAEAALVFVTPDLAEAVAGAAQASSPIIDVESREFAALLAAEPLPMAEVAAADLAWLFYTSGTTGRPKGAMLTHRNIMAMAMSYFIDVDPPSSGGCIVHAAPMSHGSGIYIIPHVVQGNCQVVPESGQFDPPEIFDLLRTWRGVSMFAAPTMVKRLVDHPGAASAEANSIRVIAYGGAPMYVADLKQAIGRFGFRFAQLYGQGESPMTITGMTRGLIEDAYKHGRDDRLGSAGIPQSVVQVRIADAEDRILPDGEIGEILARGDCVMTGYWRNPEATASTLRGGWLHTGDVGSFDAHGYLTLRDRSKDVIISGGSNIYPREVEEVLLQHPAVAEVSVVGAPDPEWGERAVAFVVRRPGTAVEAGDLDRSCLDNIARFKRPKEYRFLDQLPKNNYGKVLKTELRLLLDRN
jgi:long-chain acyl-CoA synthetase